MHPTLTNHDSKLDLPPPHPLRPNPTVVIALKQSLQYKYSGGTYGADFEPFEDCPGTSVDPGAVFLGCFKDKKYYRTMETLAYKAKNKLTNEVIHLTRARQDCAFCLVRMRYLRDGGRAFKLGCPFELPVCHGCS